MKFKRTKDRIRKVDLRQPQGIEKNEAEASKNPKKFMDSTKNLSIKKLKGVAF